MRASLASIATEPAPAPAPAEPAPAQGATREPAPVVTTQAQSDRDQWGPQRGQWELLLAGTGANDKRFDTGGFAATAGVGYFLTNDLEIGVRQLAVYDDPDKAPAVFGGMSRVAIDYHFPLGRFRPFVGGNFGWVYGDQFDDSLMSAPEAGVKIDLKRDAFLLAMLEYQFFFERSDDIDTAWNHGTAVYTLGLGIRF